jgi:hypothetical protein
LVVEHPQSVTPEWIERVALRQKGGVGTWRRSRRGTPAPLVLEVVLPVLVAVPARPRVVSR